MEDFNELMPANHTLNHVTGSQEPQPEPEEPEEVLLGGRRHTRK